MGTGKGRARGKGNFPLWASLAKGGGEEIKLCELYTPSSRCFLMKGNGQVEDRVILRSFS